jgi:hypothetical protein
MGRCRRLVPRQRKFALRSGLRAQWIVDAGYEGWGVETLSFCSVVGKIQMGCGVEVTLRCRTTVYLSMRRAVLRTEGLWSTLMYNLPTKRARTPQRPHRGDSQDVN